MMNLRKVELRVLMVLALFSTGSTRSIVGSRSLEDSGGNLIAAKTAGQAPATCSGDMSLTSQAQVDAFPATYGCAEITGTLTISGSDITHLDSLYFLTKVDGDLWISTNPNLTSLKGLSSLTYVGVGGGGPYPGFHITYNSSLNSVDGLSKLTSIKGAMEISNNSNLTNLDSLSSLTSIGSFAPSYQCLTIVNNPALISLKGLRSISSLPGTLGIENNSSLLNLDGLESLTRISGYRSNLVVRGNASLANIDGLSSLSLVEYGWVYISNNPALANLNGLSSLKQINGGPTAGLEIKNNTSLADVDGLSSLARISGSQNYLTVTGNVELVRCCGLYKVLSGSSLYCSYGCAGVTISGNGAGCTREDILAGGPCPVVCTMDITLASQAQVDAFPANYGCTEITGILTISGNDITNVDSLYLVRMVGHLAINGNQNLTNLDGLSGLSRVGADCHSCGAPGPGVIINGNSMLSDINGLSSLSRIDGNMLITSNPKLTNINGLTHLSSVGYRVEIRDNAVLTNLDGLSSLHTVGVWNTLSTSLKISGNPALTSIAGLRLISSIPGDLEISNNSSLTNLQGLDSLKAITGGRGTGIHLIITGNTALANLDGLSALSMVSGTPAQRTNPGVVIIEDNASLTNLNGLRSLTTISGGDAVLSITHNPSLINVDGLSSLTTLAGYALGFTISDNASLTNVDGFSLLRPYSVRFYLTVVNNPNLVRCCGLYESVRKVGPDGSVNISGNGAGCTKEDIIVGGPCCTSPGGCAPPEPTAQPTNLAFTNVTHSGMTVSFTSPDPSPAGFITLMRKSSSPYPEDVPVDGTIYQEITSRIGHSNVVGIGRGTSFHVPYSLDPGTNYYFDVFSYSANYDYLTVNPLAGNQRTADWQSETQPTGLIFSAVTDTTMTVSFTAPTQAPGGYITLMQAFGSPFPDDAPVDGTTYHVGDVIGSSTIVVGAGRETSLDIVYLWPGLNYYFDVLSYNNPNGVYDYLTFDPLEGSQRTTSSGSASARTADPNLKLSGRYSADITGKDRSRPFPNPFSEDITIPFTTQGQNTFVQIAIYDALGKRIADVVNQNFAAGYHEATWTRTDSFGNKASQGMYLYSIRTNESNSVVRGTLVAK
jgi:hypothetical protein